jgi:hypothetical protein
MIYRIKHTYNYRRRQRSVRKLTPVESELAFTNPPSSQHGEVGGTFGRVTATQMRIRSPGSVLKVVAFIEILDQPEM